MSICILAIETSCDETAMAIMEANGGLRQPKFKILADVVSSQIKIHRPFGGVVPMLAKREHIQNLPIVYRRILKKSEIRNPKSEIDRIAVTVGPGLEPALWTGINFAEDLAKKLKISLMGVNHLEGHLYSNWLEPVREIRNSAKIIKFPSIVLLVSGGHTMLILMESMLQWKILGETRDDAAGEAFDKVARMLNLPYPGGPEIERLAQEIRNSQPRQGFAGRAKFEIRNPIFPRPMIYDKSYDFSFSGLKTAVLYYLKDNPQSMSNTKIATAPTAPSELRNDTAEICAAFQQAVIDVLVHKTLRAAKEFKAKSVLLCGGVASNKALQKQLKVESRKLKAEFFAPSKKFNTDNAVMIGAAAYFNFLKKKKYPLKANGNLSLTY
jgi:N6-L-threonylcarbamoyladenine synthase